MKRFLYQYQNGFSLVELMVVIVIIGILSSIAVPIYTSHRAKSRTLEAQAELANLYTVQSGFFVSNRTFVTCLNYIGYDPGENIANRYYAVGFNAVNTDANDRAINRGILPSSCNNSAWHPPPTVTPPTTALHGYEAEMGGGVDREDIDDVLGDGVIEGYVVDSDGQGFLAVAGGRIESSDSTLLSVWSIDEEQNIIEVQRGY